jgi:hypothetical protein
MESHRRRVASIQVLMLAAPVLYGCAAGSDDAAATRSTGAGGDVGAGGSSSTGFGGAGGEGGTPSGCVDEDDLPPLLQDATLGPDFASQYTAFDRRVGVTLGP